jgi:MATE family multidrug resistance protein
MVLSNSGGTILQFTDRMFLAWHAPESVAGAGVAGMISICFIGLFCGVTGFTGVFAAQYLGSGRPERLGPATWQGLRLSVVFGAVCFGLSFFAEPLFTRLGHGAAVTAAEIDYFNISSARTETV